MIIIILRGRVFIVNHIMTATFCFNVCVRFLRPNFLGVMDSQFHSLISLLHIPRGRVFFSLRAAFCFCFVWVTYKEPQGFVVLLN